MADKPIEPAELIERLSVEDLCATAEAYYANIEDPTYLLAKPLTNPWEAAATLQNVAMLMDGLHLGKAMRVLDFAAGSCWFSRYLAQIGCATVSVDVSPTALELGRRLFAEHPIVGALVAEPEFLLFDGRRIDLPDASVDRVVCFDAFHHVPNQREVLSELARVLVPGGIAGFCEPGPRHSQMPESQYEMATHDVLENDVVLPEIVALAKEIGFTDFRAKLRPNRELSLSEYRELTEDAVPADLAKSIARDLKEQLAHGCIFFLHKGPLLLDSRTPLGLAHSLRSDTAKLSIRRGEVATLRFHARNTGEARWLAEAPNGIARVWSSAHVHGADGTLLWRDASRCALPHTVVPGEEVSMTIELRLEDPGHFVVEIDLLSEFVSWFSDHGSERLRIHIEVS